MKSGASEAGDKMSFLQLMSVVGPSICLVHCLVMPILLGVLPVVGRNGLAHAVSDQVIAMIIVPICLLAIVPGYLQHRKKRVLVLLALGLAFVFLGSFLTRSILGGASEIPVCILGSICLITSSLVNRRLTGHGGTCNHDHRIEMAPTVVQAD